MGANRKVKARKGCRPRANDAQVLEEAERLIVAWNARQARQMPLLFAPTIGTALATRYTGSCGCAAQPITPLRQSTSMRSTATATRP